jgi:anti-sigma factor RsiW
MSCNDVRSILEDYVDGLVIAPIAERVRDHLARCESCRIEVDASRAASLAMADWGDLEPPDGCLDKILSRIESLPPDALESVPPPPQPRLRRLGGATAWWAATAAVALMAFLFGVEVTDAFDPVVQPMTLATPLGFGMLEDGPTPLVGERVVAPVERPGDDDFIDHDGVRKRIRVIPTFDDDEDGFDFGGGLPLANPVPVDYDPRQTPR